MTTSTDTIQGIGAGTKLLLETMDRLHGERFHVKIKLGIMVVKAKEKGKKIPVSTMVLEAETLLGMALFICRRMSRRRLLGLRAVFTRARDMKRTKAAIISDFVANALAGLAIQMNRRKRRPVRRRSSIGGAFDRLHSTWTDEGAAAYIECLSADMLEKMVEKGGLS